MQKTLVMGAILVLGVGGGIGAGCAAGSEYGSETDPALLTDDGPSFGSGGWGDPSGDGGAIFSAGGNLGSGGSTGYTCFTDVPQGLPELTLGDDVTSQDAAVFDQPAGANPPFVFDPPTGVIVPAGWRSPAFFAYTYSVPSVVRLELSYKTYSTVYIAKPVLAQKAHYDTQVTGQWWTVRLPTSVWQALQCSTHESMLWSITHAFLSDTAPAGQATGSLRLLEGVYEPDMTYLEIDQPYSATAIQPPAQSYSIERLAVSSEVPQTLVDYTKAGNNCIGCHTSSPDGMDIIYQYESAPFSHAWFIGVARPGPSGPQVPAPWVSYAALPYLQMGTLMVPATSQGAWDDNIGRWLVMVNDSGRLVSLQLDDPAAQLYQGPTAVPGDTQIQAAVPAISPDGSRIVYAATNAMKDGYVGNAGVPAENRTSDLWQVPVTFYKGQAPSFGTPTPMPNGSNTADLETYPSFSRDGRLLTYTRADYPGLGYDDPTADIYVMLADGTAPPIRLTANDAPENAAVYDGYAGGLTNSWSRFGDESVVTNEGTYYFVLFSSRRGPADLWENRATGSNYISGRPIARIYMTAVLVKNDDTIQSFPAILVPGQKTNAGAHTATFTTVAAVPPPPPPE